MTFTFLQGGDSVRKKLAKEGFRDVLSGLFELDLLGIRDAGN